MIKMSTFKDLFDAYYRRHAMTKLKCPQNVYYWGVVYGEEWNTWAIETITKDDVQEWVDNIGIDSPASATRACNQMAAMFNWARKRGYININNPCQGVELFDIKARDRFLLPGEKERFLKALGREREQVQAIFYILLYTGARKSNVLSMRWDEIDPELAVWRIPEQKFKNGDPHLIPLIPEAMAQLEKLRKVNHGPWVFPGRDPRTHVKDIRKAWERIIKRANLNGVRIHDLRRTVGSYMAMNGASDAIIGKTLGHKDRRSTQVYARLNLDPVRSHLEQAALGYKQAL